MSTQDLRSPGLLSSGPPDAVMFDMDGTMIESERLLFDAWREAAREQQVVADDAVWLGMIGLSDRASRAWLLSHLAEPVAAALTARAHGLYRLRAANGLPVKDGLVDVLRLLADHAIPCAVVTSTWHDRAVEKLEATGLLRWFVTVVGGDDVEHPKPAADPYLLAARKLRVQPQRCIAIEDSITGVRAALAAGMHTIQIPDLVHPDETQRALGQLVLGSMQGVQALLAQRLTAGA